MTEVQFLNIELERKLKLLTEHNWQRYCKRSIIWTKSAAYLLL